MTTFSLRCAGRLAVLVTVLAVLAPMAFVRPAITTAQPDPPLELAHSEQTGYFFFWDPSILSLQGESSEPGVDWWRFADGEAIVDFWAFSDLWAFSAPGMATTDCVRSAFDAFALDPTTVALEALPVYGGGPPKIWSDVTEFVVTVDGPDGQEKLAVRLECGEIVPGQSLYLESVIMPARVYNERDLVRVGVGGGDFFTFEALSDPDELASIVDGAGNIVATLTTFLPCNIAEFTVLARGVGGGDVVIDPSSFIAVDGEGTSLPIALAAWSLPEARREASLSLGLGEIAVLRGVVEAEPFHSFELFYYGPSGAAILLAHDLWGCGNAGGAPVVIDIE